MIIRGMSYEDISACVRLGKIMHEESSYGHLKFNSDKVTNLAASLINTPNNLCLVADLSGEIIGMLAASITDHWFSDELMASDYVFYVRPDARGTSAAVRLLCGYKDWAERQAIKTVTIGISAEINNEVAIKLCEHYGFRQSATLMRLDI